MRIPAVIKKFYQGLLKREVANSEYVPDVKVWDNYLDSLGNAEDYIDASYKKYLCRVFCYSRFARVAMNITSFFALWAYFPYLVKPSKPLSRPLVGKALFEINEEVGYEDIFPDRLHSEYPLTVCTVKNNYYVGDFCSSAKKLYKECKKAHPFKFEYRLWLLKELARHSKYLLEENPAATIVYVNERNVALPLLKKMYEDDGRKLISFMHGEYLFQLVLAYAEFSQYYFWDSFYVDKFAGREKWTCDQYEIYTPIRLMKDNVEPGSDSPEVFLTYYCSGESKQTIKTLSKIFARIEQEGLLCKVRPHPRDSHIELVRQTFPIDQIEFPESCSIEESLENTRYAAGLMSTVLSEAFVAGKDVVVDDITEPAKYENLFKRDAIILSKDFTPLSLLLKDVYGYTGES